jgi:hypothetical protein
VASLRKNPEFFREAGHAQTRNLAAADVGGKSFASTFYSETFHHLFLKSFCSVKHPGHLLNHHCGYPIVFDWYDSGPDIKYATV